MTILYQSTQRNGITCTNLTDSKVLQMYGETSVISITKATRRLQENFPFYFTFWQLVSYWFLEISHVSLFCLMARMRGYAARVMHFVLQIEPQLGVDIDVVIEVRHSTSTRYGGGALGSICISIGSAVRANPTTTQNRCNS